MKHSEAKFLQSFSECGAVFGQVGHNVYVFFGAYSSYPAPPISGLSLYHNDFFLSHVKPWYQFQYVEELTWAEFTRLCKLGMSQRPIQLSLVASSSLDESREKFKLAFEHSMGLIESEQYTKLVPVAIESCALSGFNLYQLLLSEPMGVYLNGFWSADSGFVSHSPEILFSKKETSLSSMALAGTQSKVNRDSSILLSSEKDNREHDHVVSDITNKLSHLGVVKKDVRKIMELDHLYHLQTDINVNLDSNILFEELVQVLHPTSALGSYPVYDKETMYKIRSGESCLGAPFGLSISGVQEVCTVGIRKVTWANHQMSFAAGCGVVKGSVFEKEWQEVCDKIQSIKNNINL